MTHKTLPEEWLRPLQAWRDVARSNGNSARDSDLPKAGEVWSISWDNILVGVVMVGHFGETYAKVFPVVPSTGVVSSGITTIALDREAGGADVWLVAGFGMGNYMFECRMARPFSAEALRERIRHADQNLNETSAGDAAAREKTYAATERVVAFAQAACGIEWPSRRIGEATLNSSALERHDMTVRELGALLGIAPGAATGLWNGSSLPTRDVVERLSWETGLPEQDLLDPFDGPEERELSKPVSKSRVQGAIEKLEIEESGVRAEALRKSLRQGRQSSGLSVQQSARARVDNALDEILRGE